MDYPKDSDMMEVFECQKKQTNKYGIFKIDSCADEIWHMSSKYVLSPCCLICRYKLLLLKPCTKALSQSTKISLRMDHRGFLSLQCMILTEDKQICFVEFLVGGT